MEAALRIIVSFQRGVRLRKSDASNCGSKLRPYGKSMSLLTEDMRHLSHEQPVVLPQVSHLRHVPFLTKVKFMHSLQASPV